MTHDHFLVKSSEKVTEMSGFPFWKGEDFPIDLILASIQTWNKISLNYINTKYNCSMN